MSYNRDSNKGYSDKEHCSCKPQKCSVKTIVDPTRTIIRKTTSCHITRRIHPTRIINVHEDIHKIKNYYPVEKSYKNKENTQVYDCGRDPKNPMCRPANPEHGYNED